MRKKGSIHKRPGQEYETEFSDNAHENLNFFGGQSAGDWNNSGSEPEPEPEPEPDSGQSFTLQYYSYDAECHSGNGKHCMQIYSIGEYA